jgi:hypothetical protein
MSKLLVVLVAFLLVISCKKDDETQEVTRYGKIQGTIRLTDEFGVELGSHDSMLITAGAGEDGMSAGDGTFSIDGLTSGTYHLEYSKSGFGTFKKFNIQVNANTSAGITALQGVDYLGQKSTTIISQLTAAVNMTDTTLNFGCSLAPAPTTVQPRSFRLFFAKQTTVNSDNYLFTPSNSWTSTVSSGLVTGFDPGNFYSNGFVPGDSVYAIAYGESIRTNTYTDPVTGKKIYPNLNSGSPSNIAGFILP